MNSKRGWFTDIHPIDLFRILLRRFWSICQAIWLAYFTILLSVGIFSIGVLFPKSMIANSLGDDQSLKVTLMMILVLDFIWVTLHLVLPTANNPRMHKIWFAVVAIFGIGAIYQVCNIGLGCIVFNDIYNSSIPLIAGVSVILLFFIIPLFLQNASAAAKATDGELKEKVSTAADGQHQENASSNAKITTQRLHEWGRLAALLIMLLALFAFGLRKNDGHLEVEWKEIPAILIVFVLAEFGLILVVKAMDVESGVTEAKVAAQEAGEKATSAVTQVISATNMLSNIEKSAQSVVSDLNNSAKELTVLVQSKLWQKAKTICNTMSIPEDKQSEFWKTLEAFSDSWIPTNSESLPKETGPLIHALFDKFVGIDGDSGTVRSQKDGVSCVAVDAVFADVSEQWLKEMAGLIQQQNRKLVIYALSRLLPTQFLFPEAYWQKEDEKDKGIKSLHRFTSAVIANCQAGSEYRRVTVFEKEKDFNDLKRNHKNDEADVQCTLDDWLVLDGRIIRPLPILGCSYQDIVSRSLELVGVKVKHSHNKVTEENLKEIFGNDYNGGEDVSMLPFYYKATEHSYVFDIKVLNNLYCTILAGPVGARRGNLKSRNCVRQSMNMDQPALNTLFGESEQIELRTVLEHIGWLSIKDWYCQYMHKTSGKYDGAWWVIQEKSGDDLFKPFYLNWDGKEVLILDLLLIGSKDSQETDPKDYKWYGAAISNMSLKRTECTIRLVTDQNTLKTMANSVRTLCNDFSIPPKPNGLVNNFGMWKDWPTGMNDTPIHKIIEQGDGKAIE